MKAGAESHVSTLQLLLLLEGTRGTNRKRTFTAGKAQGGKDQTTCRSCLESPAETPFWSTICYQAPGFRGISFASLGRNT